MEDDPTIVEYFAEHERYKCGYCGSKDTNYSHGMWAHQMSVQDYQNLIDRGWRRSGMYCYKPTMDVTCCPQYTIKCHPLDFKLNKSHKKIIKKVNKYLIYGTKPGSDNRVAGSQDDGGDEESGGNMTDAGSTLAEKMKPSDIILPSSKKMSTKNARRIASDTAVQASQTSSPVQPRSSSDTVMSYESGKGSVEESKSKSIPTSGAGPDPSKPKCRKAKAIRAERRALKQSQSEEGSSKQKQTKQNQEKSLEDFLSEPDRANNPKHKLELYIIRSWPPNEDSRSEFTLEHSIYHKYQMTIHKDPPQKPNQNQYKRFLCDSPLMILLCRTAPESHHFRLSFHESYAIYRKYQMAVHRDPPEECDKLSFKNFLVDSPLEEKYEVNGPPDGYGSFHQHYILDGKLIAVAVLDILPASLSSVYLYYDPDYSFLGLGVYSALREIALVRELNRSAPELKYYYMGFYIHNCLKMKYKGQYTPSYLLCPESYEWVPIEKCRQKLDASKYARLSESGDDKDKDIDVNQVLILHKGNMLTYGFFKAIASQGADEEEVKEYAGLVGKTCAERMLLVRK